MPKNSSFSSTCMKICQAAVGAAVVLALALPAIALIVATEGALADPLFSAGAALMGFGARNKNDANAPGECSPRGPR